MSQTLTLAQTLQIVSITNLRTLDKFYQGFYLPQAYLLTTKKGYGKVFYITFRINDVIIVTFEVFMII
jgi:hypothetical protein